MTWKKFKGAMFDFSSAWRASIVEFFDLENVDDTSRWMFKKLKGWFVY